MPRESHYSLSRLIGSILNRGTPSGYERERSAELERGLPKKLRARQGGVGTFVPSSAFGPAGVETRDLTTTGGAGLIGQKVKQLPGVVGWSACIRSGAQLVGPLESYKLSIFHDSNLPLRAGKRKPGW